MPTANDMHASNAPLNLNRNVGTWDFMFCLSGFVLIRGSEKNRNRLVAAEFDVSRMESQFKFGRLQRRSTKKLPSPSSSSTAC
jgi:hypothetical protein